MADDFRYPRIEPAECRHCPGIHHWPHQCPTPQGREEALREIKCIVDGMLSTATANAAETSEGRGK